MNENIEQRDGVWVFKDTCFPDEQSALQAAGQDMEIPAIPEMRDPEALTADLEEKFEAVRQRVVNAESGNSAGEEKESGNG